MNITITGNIDSFQLSQNVKLIDVSLRIGSDAKLGIATVELVYGNDRFASQTAESFSRFAQSTKGFPPVQLAFTLESQFGLNAFREKFAIKGTLELALLKSLFMVYLWVEKAINQPSWMFNFKQLIFNEFIVDYSGVPEIQRDIYFIAEKYNTAAYQPHLTRLVELNLINRCDFEWNDTAFRNYFISFIQPGVSRDFFAHDDDFVGNNTYSLWKKILDDRDLRLRSWMTSRF